MNEAQLVKEINKQKRIIASAEKTMSNNDFTQVGKDIAEAYPLGVGFRSDKRYVRDQITALNKAGNYTQASNRKESASLRLNSLEKALKDVKGTGKTQKELQAERTKKVVQANQTTRKWAIEQGQFGRVYVSGNYRVNRADTTWFVEANGKQYMTSSKQKAFAIVELLDKKANK